MALQYYVTLHVRTDGNMGDDVHAAPTPLLYGYFCYKSVGDTVDEPPSGTPPDQLKDEQNQLLVAKLQELFDSAPPAFKGNYVLDPDPVPSRPNGPTWDDGQSGIVATLMVSEPAVPGSTLSSTPTVYEPEFGGQKIRYFIGIYPRDYANPLNETVTVRNEGGSVEGLQLIYARTRTRASSSGITVSVRSRGPVDGHPTIVSDGTRFHIRWEGGLPQGSTVKVQIRHYGEPLTAGRHRWIVEPGDVNDWKGRVSVIADGADLDQAPFADLPDEEKIYELRKSLIATQVPEKAPERAYHEFFLQLDQQTGGLTDDVLTKYTKLGDLLVDRTLARAKQPDGKIALPTTDEQKSVKDASKHLVTLFEEHFTDSGGNLSIAQIEAAYEHFSSGKLWLGEEGVAPHSTPWGVPNSANYFSFAELALTAIEINDPYQAVWTEVLSVLVRTTQVFTFIYQGVNTLWGDYKFTNFEAAKQAMVDFQGLKDVTPNGVEALRTRFAEIAAKAFKLELYSGSSPVGFGGG